MLLNETGSTESLLYFNNFINISIINCTFDNNMGYHAPLYFNFDNDYY